MLDLFFVNSVEELAILRLGYCYGQPLRFACAPNQRPDTKTLNLNPNNHKSKP